jgi:hypothetical protein
MDDTFAAYYDPSTSTLQLSGSFDPEAWASVPAEIDRAFRRTACSLTVDLTRAAGVPAHSVGRLVHLCNCSYPGTMVRAASRSSTQAA